MPELSPLEVATRSGDLLEVKRLLKRNLLRKSQKGAANKPGPSGWTPLHHAAFHGHLEIVMYLVEDCKVQKHATNNLGDTALCCASSAGHSHIVRYLIAMGANAQHQNSLGSTPLHTAAAQGQLEVAKCLVEEAFVSVHVKGNSGGTALHDACYHGHLEVARYLIETCRANVNAQNKSGYTPLHFACHRNHLHLVIYLVESCQADPQAESVSRQTPLTVAIRNGWLQVVQYLVVHAKADATTPDPLDGTTAVQIAKVNGHAEIVAFLLQYTVPDSVEITNAGMDTATQLTGPHDYFEEEEKVEDSPEMPTMLESDGIVEVMEPNETQQGTGVSSTSLASVGPPLSLSIPSVIESSSDSRVSPRQQRTEDSKKEALTSRVYSRQTADLEKEALTQRIAQLEVLLHRVTTLERHLLGDVPPAQGVPNLFRRLERLEQVSGIQGEQGVEVPVLRRDDPVSIAAMVGSIDDDDEEAEAT